MDSLFRKQSSSLAAPFTAVADGSDDYWTARLGWIEDALTQLLQHPLSASAAQRDDCKTQACISECELPRFIRFSDATTDDDVDAAVGKWAR